MPEHPSSLGGDVPPRTAISSSRLDCGDWTTRLLRHGSGDAAVVFVHALGADATVWTEVLTALPESLSAVAYDVRGQGVSTSIERPFTLELLADDLSSLLSALDVQECVLVGLSMGGMIAQLVAGRMPLLVNRLVLMDTACTLAPAARQAWLDRIDLVGREGMAAVVDSTLERWFPPDVDGPDDVVRSRLAAVVAGLDARHYAAAARALSAVDLVDNARRIACPTVVAVGESDIALPPECSALLADLIPGAELVTFPGVGHCPPVERPAAVVEVLRRMT